MNRETNPGKKRKDYFGNKLKNNMETENEQGLRIAGVPVSIRFSRIMHGLKKIMEKFRIPLDTQYYALYSITRKAVLRAR